MSISLAQHHHPQGIDGHIHQAPTSFVRKYVFSIDHKIIGIQYFVTTGIFMAIAGLLAEVIRTQLLSPNAQFVSPDTFNEAFSVHGSAMVWLVIIPMLTGAFGNFVMPLQIGARDVAFPWLNMASFWMFPPAGLLLFGSFVIGAPQAGWTEYPPISGPQYGPPGTTMWCMAIFLVGVSSTLTGINFLVTMYKMRAPGMTFTRMPLFVWAQMATAILSMIATTALAGALLALFLERVFGIPFYDPARGGSPILWQHMFWFYSHPAVYIMILPAFGIISEIFPTFARKPIFGYKAIAFSSMAIALLSFMVWAHHMFTSGLSPSIEVAFMLLTMVIAVPTGIKIFSWVMTLFGGKIHFTTAMLFAIGFIITFLCGGLTGIYLAAVPVDLHLHGTYFIVAHLHYVLFGGSVMGIFAGLYYWWPKMTGRMMNETLGKWHFALLFTAFNLTFMPMHFLGIMGMPRRVSFYVNDPWFIFWNELASIASYAMAGSFLIFLYNALSSLKSGALAGPNPWGARTLEWQIPSPPHYYNFKNIPAVYSAPYEFDKPLPYGNLQDELDDSKVPPQLLHGHGEHAHAGAH